MVYTVSAAFDEFCQNISLSSTYHDTANKRRDRLVSLLKNDFTILDSFSTGSIPRYTAISGYADLDIMVVLYYGKHMKDKLPSEVLAGVQKSLSGYKTRVRRNGQAVTLYYDTWPNVDIVPVSITVNDDGSVKHYNVPNMNNETWLKSRPRKHSSALTDHNGICGDKFKRIIKMIKWWNKQHGDYLQSFHIEVLALQIFTSTISDYSWSVFEFFDRATTLVASSLYYEDDYVDSYLDSVNRSEAVKRLKTARDKAFSAWYLTYGENNDHQRAITTWRQIFGEKFPVYGSY